MVETKANMGEAKANMGAMKANMDETKADISHITLCLQERLSMQHT
jgi:hypothetical protein